MTGRTSSCQFAAGNTFGRGRPHNQTEREYIRAMSDVCSIEDWQEITKRAVDDAKKGDARARQGLIDYLIGQREEKSLEKIAFNEIVGNDPIESKVKSWEEGREDREAIDKYLAKFNKDLIKTYKISKYPYFLALII